MHKKSSVARIVIVSGLLSVLLIGALFGTLTYVKQRITDRLLDNFAAQEQLVGKAASSTLSERAGGFFEDLRLIAANSSVAATSDARCSQAVKQFSSVLTTQFENLARVGTNGMYFCSLKPQLNGMKVASLNSDAAELLPMVNPRETISRVIPSTTNFGHFDILLNEPTYTNGTFTGYISATVDLNEFMNDYLSTIKFADTGFVSVFDAHHDILYSHFSSNIGHNFYSSDIQALFPNHGLNGAITAADEGNTTIVRYSREDVKKVASVQPFNIIHGTQWTVIVTVPEAEVGQLFVNPVLDNAFNIVILGASIAVIAAIIFVMIYALHENELLRAKSQFVSLTSHQLRTPLTAIRLFSEMLEDPAVGPLTDTQKDYTAKIRVSTDRMIKLVGNILNVSRVELKRLKIEPEPVEIAAFVRNQVEEVSPLAAQKNVRLVVDADAPVTVRLDPTLFGQIIHNLLTNAVRYSPYDEGEVGVTVVQDHRCITVSVADNGIGIPKSDRHKIFGQFYRAENAKRVEGEGTGLGLFLAHSLAKLTGCTLSFEARKPKGTVFHVTIPASGMKPMHGDAKIN